VPGCNGGIATSPCGVCAGRGGKNVKARACWSSQVFLGDLSRWLCLFRERGACVWGHDPRLWDVQVFEPWSIPTHKAMLQHHRKAELIALSYHQHLGADWTVKPWGYLCSFYPRGSSGPPRDNPTPGWADETDTSLPSESEKNRGRICTCIHNSILFTIAKGGNHPGCCQRWKTGKWQVSVQWMQSLFEVMKKFWKTNVGDGYVSVYLYSVPLNSSLKNG
jgi:hypothetical protein